MARRLRLPAAALLQRGWMPWEQQQALAAAHVLQLLAFPALRQTDSWACVLMVTLAGCCQCCHPCCCLQRYLQQPAGQLR
jgi:hypothetical protein